MTGERLIVPRGPLRGGAAQQAPQAVDPGAAQAVARFGDAMADVGRVLEEDRLSNELGRARVDIANTLSQARLELAEETDPAAVNTRWATVRDEARTRILSGLDPRNQNAAALAFDETAGRHGVSLGEQAIGLRRDRTLGTLAELGTALAASPGMTNPEARAAALGQFADQARAAVATGAMTPEQAEIRIERERVNLAEAAAQRMLGEDPAALVAAIDAGAYDDMPGDLRERRRRQAQMAATRIAEKAARQAEHAANVAAREGAEKLADLTALARQGQVMEGEEALLADPVLKGLPGYAEAAAAVEVREALPKFALMTPAQQREAIQKEQEKPVSARWQGYKLQALKAASAELIKDWRRDPIAQAAALGVGDVAPLPLGDPDADWPKAFADRRRRAEALAEQGYVEGAPVYLSAAERATFKSMAAPDQDAALRAKLAGDIAAGFGPAAAHRVFGAVSDQPVFAHVGWLLAAGGSSADALAAFEGEAALRAGTVTAPSKDWRQERMDRADGIGAFLADQFRDDAGVQKQILATADAIWAAGARDKKSRNPDDGDAQARWHDALQIALGQGRDHRGRPTGGVTEVRGALTWLPVGVRKDAFENALTVATRRLRPRYVSEAAKRHGHKDTPGVDLFSRAAVDERGRPIEARAIFGGVPLTHRVAKELRLEAVGDGVYRLVLRDADGVLRAVKTGDGGDFLLGWSRLAAVVAEEAGE